MKLSESCSRREWLSEVLRPWKRASSGRAQDAQKVHSPVTVTAPVAVASTPEPAVARMAVIQGRFCVALTSFCAVCVERCPVPGALQVTRGMPSVVADKCTGCGICFEVCPAPRKAVLMLPLAGRPGLGDVNNMNR